MAEMNPNYPAQRGCWLEREENTNAVTVHDYPTWRRKNGDFVQGDANLTDVGDRRFDDIKMAIEFCAAENYVRCAVPKTREERDAIMAKRGVNADDQSYS